MAEISMGTVYDINKQLVAQYEKELRGKALYNRIDNIVIPYFQEKLSSENYFMLLCHERSDYTVFRIKDFAYSSDTVKTLVMELEECLHNRGAIYGIDRTEDTVALEIWIKSNEDNEMSCYYLFPYTQAIIEI